MIDASDTCDKSSHHSPSDECDTENASVFGLRHTESDVYSDFSRTCLGSDCQSRAKRGCLGALVLFSAVLAAGAYPHDWWFL